MSLPSSAVPLPFDLSGRFRFERCVGKGGMGAVFEVFDRIRGQRVALKMLSWSQPLNLYRTEGSVHAALYIIWDKTTAYYWLGGSAIAHRNSGALTLLIWEIMQDVAQKGIQIFDFTGSDLENLESFFSAFNAEKKTYFKVSRYGNRALKFVDKLLRK